MAGTIEIFEGVESPCMLEEVVPPQAQIKLREIIIKNFFIDISEYVVLIKSNNMRLYKLLYDCKKNITIRKLKQEILLLAVRNANHGVLIR